MSTTGKAVLWIVVIVLVGGGIWWLVSANGGAPQNNAAANQAGTNTVAGTNATSSQASNLPQGDSDQAISQDMASVNTQMNGLSSDTANVNSSMNDQPVQQAE